MSDSRWVKEGDFSKKLPPEINANCHYFVKYTKDGKSLSLFKRPLKSDPNMNEFKIQLTNLTQAEIDQAIKRTNTVIMNSHHTRGLFYPADSILGQYNNNDKWLTKDIEYIDKLVALNEIKDEVLASLELDPHSLQKNAEAKDAAIEAVKMRIK